MVVVDGPERREVAGAHGGEEVLPPAALQVHQAPQAALGVRLHHLQAVGDVRLVENPSAARRGRERQVSDHVYSLILTHCVYM